MAKAPLNASSAVVPVVPVKLRATHHMTDSELIGIAAKFAGIPYKRRLRCRWYRGSVGDANGSRLHRHLYRYSLQPRFLR